MTNPQAPVRILLVEDSADDAELIERTLRIGGLAAEVRVVDGETGLRAELAAFAPDLVLADWSLPGFSGGAAVLLAREWDANVPCILVSGTVGEELVVEALRTGATDYVLKHRLEALVPAVRRAIEEASARRERGRLEAELAVSRAAMHEALDAMADPFVVCSAIRRADGAINDFRVDYANRAAGVFMRAQPASLPGRDVHALLAQGFGDWYFDICRAVVETGKPYAAEAVPMRGPRNVQPPETRLTDVTIAPSGAGFFLLLRDVTDRARLSRERDRLAAVVEQTIDGVIVTDPDGVIAYANPAFQRTSGRTLEELVGQPAGTLAIELAGPAAFAGLTAATQDGKPWFSEIQRTLPDGTVSHLEFSVTPVRDDVGAISSYVVVSRDLTELREAEAELDLQKRIRSALADSLRNIPDAATVEQAAQAICDELVTLPFVDVATIQVFLGADDVQVVATNAPSDWPVAGGDVLPPAVAAMIRERAARGPWAWDAATLSRDGGFRPGAFSQGTVALAYGPIVHANEVVGAVSIGSLDEHFARTLVDKLPGIVSFGATSSALLAERLDKLRRESALRGALRATIASRSFHPLFQPLVDLESGEAVGYEALTRFDSGQRPDLCFADAWSVGLGTELELATLEAAVAQARRLPPGRWLDLNISPRMLASCDCVARVLESSDRPIVLEVTEHDVIEDYEIVRETVRALGQGVRLAVDDAGAGVANFGHIVELRPDFVKLDISLVRHVNTDLGRQALVMGMHHFSRTSGCRLVAEGIESKEEADTLRALGVEFGQGYLFGRPEPVGVSSSDPMSERGPIHLTRARVARLRTSRHSEVAAAAPVATVERKKRRKAS